MDLHRVRRLAEVLVASQLRSGRTSSNPTSLFGRGYFLALVDTGVFLFGAAAAFALLSAARPATATIALAVTTASPFVPLIAVAAVVVAGLLFELTTTARFAASDAANWLPIAPAEYVAASSAAIAYSYSPAVALFLGGLLPLAAEGNLVPLYVLAAVLSILALYEGGVLIEMVRAATQRAGSGRLARRGALSIVLRAALLVVLILALDLAFNPVFLFGLVQHFSAFGVVTAAVPVFWSAEALRAWGSGQVGLGLTFAIGQAGFVAVLVWLAGLLRERFWVPAATEVRAIPSTSASGHPVLRAFGLSPVEAAIAAKDLKGFVRRREMLPTLVVPVVLVVLLVIEGAAFGALGSILWMGWVAGFFALLLAGTSVGQERRSLQWLYAYPVPARAVLRAKLAAVLVPGLLGAAGMALVVALLNRFSLFQALGLAALLLAAATVLAVWGLVFAARFSDFQERPRPQFLRPAAMLGALGSGMIFLFAILLPGSLVLLAPSPSGVDIALGEVAVVLASGTLAFRWADRGFDRLFREIPF